MQIAILDGYVDEPSCLGVPPYISPYPRYIGGAIKDIGKDYLYLTIDDLRENNERAKKLRNAKLLILIAGAIVPGKYLRGMPISLNEILRIAKDFKGIKILCGAFAKYGFGSYCNYDFEDENFNFIAKKDADTCIYDFLKNGEFSNRLRTMEEWKKWSFLGTEVVKQHRDFPSPLITEIETYRGCIRYLSGGCSFCTDVLFGKPIFRNEEDIIKEIEMLNKLGVVNFRLGAQTCFFSYKNNQGKPNVSAIEKLLKGIRKKTQLKVLHLDNANPSVIANNEKESEEIAKLIVKYCTSGNVLAFGMESADEKVIKENNLNATPNEVMKAIEIINKYGKEVGENGLPKLLPGINFVLGLRGESEETYELNFNFLKMVLERNLLLRRINIRQVNPIRLKYSENFMKYKKQFIKFKEKVREEIDKEMLKKVVPYGSILKDVFTEKIIGNITFGRQIGSYPILIGIPYIISIGKFVDVFITSHGKRSLTAIEFPFLINKMSLRAIECLPNVGRKRAVRIFKKMPFKNEEEFLNAIDDEKVGRELLRVVRIL